MRCWTQETYPCDCLVAVYVPPTATPQLTAACDIIHSPIGRLQTQLTASLVTSNTSLPTSHNMWSVPPGGERLLDLLYANVSLLCSPTGWVRQKLIQFTLHYAPVVKREPVTTSSIRRGSEEASVELQGCFVTGWETVSVSPTTPSTPTPLSQLRHCYPNNKLWVTRTSKPSSTTRRRPSDWTIERR